MAKKRRSTTTSTSKAGPRELNPEDAKIAAFNTWEDIPDEEDDFHIARDKVLLESENNVRRGRRRNDEYGDVSDEEVLALDDYVDDGSEDSADSEEEAPRGNEDEDAPPTDDEDPDAEGWGTSKRDYYGGSSGDAIATEQDAALEAAEALRLQAKQAAALHEADYGFDEAEWATAAAEPTKALAVGQTLGGAVTEALPTAAAAVLEDLSAEERTSILEARHPEFRPLAEEFSELQALHAPLGLSAAAAEAVGETVRSSVAVVKFRALSAYLGVLSMYFAVLSGPETAAAALGQDQGARVREHGVMEGLLRCRRMWEAVRGLEVEEIRSVGAEKKRKKEAATAVTAAADRKAPTQRRKNTEKPKEPKRKRVKFSPAFSDSDSDSAAKGAKKPKRTIPTTDLSDLTDLAASFRPTTTTKKPTEKTPEITTAHDTTDFGDDSTLAALDAEQKAARRRNLRFYTSQIVSKSAKREAAGQSVGGDTDLPHRERRKEKELRLAAEAARRRQQGDGAELGDSDPDEEDVRVASSMREDAGNEYYDLVAGKLRMQKERKRAEHEARRVGGVVVRVVEEGPADGKRAVGYTIDKNKGLTPHRKKDVRNPRVKKRKKYEAAKKKLGSTKAVFRGGLQGSYGGEATGIKKNLVKSVKFR